MSQIQDVKNATDIIQILGERIQLNRSGSNWRALCPFHAEKSPSFFVSEQLQRYKCFGCGESGDVFTFLEKYEGMTFGEALQMLADRAGITLEKSSFSPEDDRRKTLLEILDLTKEYYHFLLTKHKLGEPARAYLKQRGVSAESIKVFQLGYALPAWDELLKYLHSKKKYALRDIEEAGLILPGNRGDGYDRFRDRVMFPLTDHRGRVVGFSGRMLRGDEKEAKYINSPETSVYHKGQMLFGYSQLYQHLRQENEALIVEGEFDVISSAQAHVNHVVAVKGSALTEDHMRLLSRTVNKIILSFDMDSAGLAATKRAIQVAEPFGLEVRVIDFSLSGEDPNVKKKDPDDLARTQPQLWRQMVKSSMSVYDFFIQAALKNYDVQTPEGKRHSIDDLAPIFGNISHAVEYEFYVEKLAGVLGVTKSTVESDLQKFKTLHKKGAMPVRTIAASQTKDVANEKKLTHKMLLEDFVFFLLLHSSSEKIFDRAEKLKHMTFYRPGAKHIIQKILESQPPFDLTHFSTTLAEDLQQLVFELSMQKKYIDLLPTLNSEKEWQKSVPELIDLDISDEITRITQELDQADETRQQELLHRIVQLRNKSKIKEE